MGIKRTHVVLSEQIVKRIDRLVGKRGRSRFLGLAAERELDRLRLLQALDGAAGSWKDDQHPEMKAGTAQWVTRLRKKEASRTQDRTR